MPRPVVLAARLLALAVMLGACARNRQAEVPAPVDPVGRFDYTSETGGQTVRGTITISGAAGAYQAVMTTGGASRDLFFQNVTVNGNQVTMLAETPAQKIAVHLTIVGSAITGDWTMGPRTGTLRGTRASGGGGGGR